MSTSELKPIILYDIPCSTPGRPWSPNTAKARYCLGYKQLPFTTVWVELCNIMEMLQSKGVSHPPYTLPVIEDPNTSALIVDSLAIATYLDETYPETPKVLTATMRAEVEGVESVFSFSPTSGAGAGASAPGDDEADGVARLVFVYLAIERLNSASKMWYHQRRTARHGELWTALVDACSASPEGRAERVRQGIEAIEDIWRKVAAMYIGQGDLEQGTVGGSFAHGAEPCFLDFAVAGRVKFALGGLRSSEAEMLRILVGERLWRLVEDLERYFKC